MQENQQDRPQPITRERWAETVTWFATPGMERDSRRRHARYDAHGSVELAFKLPVIRAGSIVDVSLEGLCVRCSEPIPPRTPVVVDLSVGDETVLATGEVRNCTQMVGTAKAYHVGIRLVFAHGLAPHAGRST